MQIILERDGLPQLLEALRQRGYQLVGPTVRDGAIVYDELTTVEDLPIGWTDEQKGGTYRLQRRDDDATGRSNDEIAQEMRISLNSVKSYIRSAYRKTGVQSRSQAVLWAVTHGVRVEVLQEA